MLFDDAAIAPLGAPCVDVVATAKKDLKAKLMRKPVAYRFGGGMPSEGRYLQRPGDLLCRRRVAGGRLSDDLRMQQNAYFAPQKALNAV